MTPVPGNSHLLSVIIPARNEETLLPRTLASIRRAEAYHRSSSPDPVEVDVIVSDNLSTDRTAEIAAAAGARVVQAPKINIASVRNRGAGAARGDLLLFVDADSLLHRRQIHRVVSLLSRRDVIGGGAPCTSDRKAPDTEVGAFLLNALARYLRTAFGSFMFCRKEDLEAIGGFDERADAGEELIFSEAMQKLGRSRRQEFRILTECPVATSLRKIEMHGRPKTTLVLLSLAWDLLHHRPIVDRYHFWYPERSEAPAGRP